MNNSIPFNQVKLYSERLQIRPLETADAAALFAIFSDHTVMRYGSGATWDSIDQAHELITRYNKALLENSFLGLGIVDLQTDTVIGTCCLFHLDKQCKRAEIGYSLSRSSWGKGYMQEALTELIHFAFNELHLHRLEADIDPRNESSLRSVERLGFIKEGHLRERWIVGDEVSDSIFFGLLRRDWQRCQVA